MVFIDLWEEQLIREGKSINTISSYLRDIKKFIEWFEETYDQVFDGKILEVDIKTFQSYLLNIKHLNINTIVRNLVSISRFNEFLVSIGKSNSLSDLQNIVIRKADVYDREVTILDNKSLNKLRRTFYSIDNKRDTAIFEVMINTGIRVSELISLELEDILLTRRNGENNYSYIRIRNGKGKVYREVPLNSIARKALSEYLICRSNTTTNKVFIGERGPLQRFAINKILIKYCIIAQIDKISPHILRHTFATKLITEHSTDLITVSRLLGHSSSKVTEDYYINSSTDNKINAVKSLDF